MAEKPSLYERRMAAGVGHWADVYGGETDNFEFKRHHDGYYVDGVHHGKSVKNILDVFNGVLCRIIRPDHPKLQEARRRAEETGVEHIGKTVLHEEIVQLMERLKGEYDALGIGPGRALLAISGGVANGMAHRLMRGFTRNQDFQYLKNCYHGDDVLGIATTNAPNWPPEENGPELVGGKYYIAPGDLFGLRQALERSRFDSSNHRLAGNFWFEDIKGVGGSFANPGEEFLTEAMEMVMEFGGAAVNDNVQSGMRRGSYLSVPKWLLRKPNRPLPLIITLAKAFANDAPLGAVLVPEMIHDDMKRYPKRYGLHWDTFSENVRTSALANAVHEVYTEENLGARTPEVRQAVVDEIQPLVDKEKGPITEIRGDGIMIGVALKNPQQTIGAALGAAPEHGLLIGKGADALRISPLADTPTGVAEEIGKRLARLIDSLPKAA